MLEYFRRRVHASWLITWCATGVLVGVGLSLVVEPMIAETQSIITVITLWVLAFSKRIRGMVVLALVGGLLLGLMRGGTLQHELQAYKPYYGNQVQVRGTVSEDTVFGSRGDQRIQLGNVLVATHKLPGKVWISSNSQIDIKRGDIVMFQGILGEGFGNMPATMFRARLVDAERPIHGDVAREVRDWFASGVRNAIPEPEASLGVGYLVGQRSTLPEELDNQLQLLGLTHVVVASGYNLTILVRFTRRTFVKKSKYLATLAACLMIVSFVLVTGFSPSMSRAALVTGLSLLAWYFGRAIHPMVILPFSAAVTALINPAYVWGDIGWYLSFTAFAGIMILAPLLKHFLWGKDATLRAPIQILLETTAAQVATLPIIAYVFGQYSLLALPANLLVLPLVPLAMLLTFFAGIVGVTIAGVAVIAGWPAMFVLNYMTVVVNWLAQLPGAASELKFSAATLVVSYMCLIFVSVFLWRKTGHTFRNDNIVE